MVAVLSGTARPGTCVPDADFDDHVDVAPRRVELVGRGRAERGQPSHAAAPCDRAELVCVLTDQVCHRAWSRRKHITTGRLGAAEAPSVEEAEAQAPIGAQEHLCRPKWRQPAATGTRGRGNSTNAWGLAALQTHMPVPASSVEIGHAVLPRQLPVGDPMRPRGGVAELLREPVSVLGRGPAGSRELWLASQGKPPARARRKGVAENSP